MAKGRKGKLAQLLNAAGGSTAAHAPGAAKSSRKKQRKDPSASANANHAFQASGLLQHQADADVQPTVEADAYQQLMGMLVQGKSKASQALRRRRLQEQGDSDASSSEESVGEDGEADMTSEEEEGSQGQQAMPAPRKQTAIAATDKSEDGSGSGTASEDSEDDEQGNAEDGSGADGTDNGTKRKAKGSTTTGLNGQSARVLTPVADTWAEHLEQQLTEGEITALHAAPRAKWVAATPGGNSKALSLTASVWHTAGTASLPATPARLEQYSVKERLITRWREVHAEDAAAAAATAAASAPAGTGAGEGLGNGSASNGAAEGGAPTQEPGGQGVEAMAVDGATRPARTRRKGQAAAGPAGPAGQDVAAVPAQGDGAGDWVCQEQQAMFAALHSYSDVVWGCRPYAHKLDAPDPLQDAYLLHCLNHIVKTADRIKRGNDRLEKAKQQAAEDKAGDGPASDVPEVPRDQGFTRPKVLILLPQRNLAFRCVLRLVRLAMREARADSVAGKARFVEQFTDLEETPEDQLDAGMASRRSAKPAEWRALLGSGNTDDHFRLGIKITRGAIRLFSNLFESDIIIASPLALATKLAEDARRREERAEAAASKGGRSKGGAAQAKADGSQGDGAADFLSSIEVLIIDRADVMTMQNWTHVETVVEALNQLPREQHGVDIMRVREWALAGWAKHYRQTVLLSSFLNPHMNALMGGQLTANYRGKLRLQPQHQGVLQHVIPQVQQVFERFSAPSPTEASEARLRHFTGVVWPRLKESAAVSAGGLLLFVPSYFDFIRVRNFMKAEDSDLYECISEYTAGPDVTSARNRFYQRRVKMLIYTERAHFYHRHRVRGIRDVLFYGPPDHASFYTELVNLLESTGSSAGSAHGSVGVLYCKWDVLALERLVGAGRAAKMIKGDTSTFMFC